MKRERCQATTTSGNPCNAQARHGKTVCPWHDQDLAQQRKAWSGQGGRAKSNVVRAKKQLSGEALTMGELQAALCRALRRVETGELEPGPANAMASLARAITSVAEVGTIEERIAALEQRSGVGDTKKGWSA